MEVESTNKKWVAGGGTTALGIIGTTLGGLNTLTNGGLLGGLTGNGNGNGCGCGNRSFYQVPLFLQRYAYAYHYRSKHLFLH